MNIGSYLLDAYSGTRNYFVNLVFYRYHFTNYFSHDHWFHTTNRYVDYFVDLSTETVKGTV